MREASLRSLRKSDFPMPRNVLAFVDWKQFRSGGKKSRPERSYYYAIAAPHLHARVGQGGTLWVITRKPNTKEYSLAYKLVNCRTQKDIPEDIRARFDSYSGGKKSYSSKNKAELQFVVSNDWESCEYFPANDVTNVLLRLKFETGLSMKECKNIGLKILGLPEINPLYVPLLEGFALNLMKKRIVFLSYSRENKRLADKIVDGLGKSDVIVYRDIEYLKHAEPWKEALERVIRGCDLFMVLITDKSAKSQWVQQEVTWAIDEIEHGGCVTRILPLIVDKTGWKDFPELHQFHAYELTKDPDPMMINGLARSISGLTRRRSTGWSMDSKRK